MRMLGRSLRAVFSRRCAAHESPGGPRAGHRTTSLATTSNASPRDSSSSQAASPRRPRRPRPETRNSRRGRANGIVGPPTVPFLCDRACTTTAFGCTTTPDVSLISDRSRASRKSCRPIPWPCIAFDGSGMCCVCRPIVITRIASGRTRSLAECVEQLPCDVPGSLHLQGSARSLGEVERQADRRVDLVAVGLQQRCEVDQDTDCAAARGLAEHGLVHRPMFVFERSLFNGQAQEHLADHVLDPCPQRLGFAQRYDNRKVVPLTHRQRVRPPPDGHNVGVPVAQPVRRGRQDRGQVVRRGAAGAFVCIEACTSAPVPILGSSSRGPPAHVGHGQSEPIAVLRNPNKPKALVEGSRLVVLRIDDDAGDPQRLADLRRSLQGVAKELAPDPLALHRHVHCEATDQDHWDLRRLPLRDRSRNVIAHEGPRRQRVESSNDTVTFVEHVYPGGADTVGGARRGLRPRIEPIPAAVERAAVVARLVESFDDVLSLRQQTGTYAVRPSACPVREAREPAPRATR